MYITLATGIKEDLFKRLKRKNESKSQKVQTNQDRQDQQDHQDRQNNQNNQENHDTLNDNDFEIDNESLLDRITRNMSGLNNTSQPKKPHTKEHLQGMNELMDHLQVMNKGKVGLTGEEEEMIGQALHLLPAPVMKIKRERTLKEEAN